VSGIFINMDITCSTHCIATLTKSVQIDGRNFNGLFNRLLCLNPWDVAVFYVKYVRALESFQDILCRDSAVLRTYQRYFTKFPPLENAIFSELPLSFYSTVSIARSEIYFSPEACAELSKIPACRLARASTLRRNAKSVVGAPSFFGPCP